MESYNIGDRVHTSLVKYGNNNRGTIIEKKLSFNGRYFYTIRLDNDKIIQVSSLYVYRIYEDN